MSVIAVQDFISNLKQQGLFRKRQQVHENQWLNFSSNDYLSLSTDERVKKAYEKGIRRYPVGSGGSMVVCGYHTIHHRLENEFARALNVEQCLLFPSGYAANLSIASLLARMRWHAFIDRSIHASVYDGLVQTGVAYSRFRHNDIHDLNIKLHNCRTHKVVLTEGIFSMSGQQAPLSEMTALQKLHGFEFIVDEAHAFGVIGREGLGAVISAGVTEEIVPLRVIPLGKALAASGAIVAGKAIWIDALLQCARPAIYSTALSPAVAYGVLKTLDIMRQADERREALQHLIQYFRESIRNSPYLWRHSTTAIQQLQLGCPFDAQKMSEFLNKRGIFCIPMRRPTVERKETGLRIILNYAHKKEHIDYLLRCIHQM